MMIDELFVCIVLTFYQNLMEIMAAEVWLCCVVVLTVGASSSNNGGDIAHWPFCGLADTFDGFLHFPYMGLVPFLPRAVALVQPQSFGAPGY